MWALQYSEVPIGAGDDLIKQTWFTLPGKLPLYDTERAAKAARPRHLGAMRGDNKYLGKNTRQPVDLIVKPVSFLMEDFYEE